MTLSLAAPHVVAVMSGLSPIDGLRDVRRNNGATSMPGARGWEDRPDAAESSCNAAALPERIDLVVWRNRTLACPCDCSTFVVTQDVDSRPTGLDFTGKLGQLLLIFLWPTE